MMDTASPETRLVLLGTGTPNAEPGRSGPAAALVSPAGAVLIDAGPGVVRRAAAAAEQGVTQLAPEKLDCLLLTHLHSDHTAGLADVLLTPWVLGRESPLRIYGPPGTRAMVEHLLAAYAADIRERLEGLQPATPDGWRAQVTEIEAGPVAPKITDARSGTRTPRLRIEAIPVRHGSLPAFGYKFSAADRTIVVSGDTAPCDTLEAAARGCDLLLHEAYSSAGFATLSLEWQRYHAGVHTSAHALGQLAARARPALLVIYHALLWGMRGEELLGEIRAQCAADVRLGEDLADY